jgi:sporulation-control protein
MSFFNRFLASVGIGAAQVNTMLQKDKYTIGEEVRGVVKIIGGEVEQSIDEIYISLMTQYKREINDKKVTETVPIAKFLISKPFIIKPREQLDLNFSFVLPNGTPITNKRTPVWLVTGLDIKNAVDPKDEDLIEVLPHPYMQVTFNALNELGFRLRNAECEYAPKLGRTLPFVQEFEFVPTSNFKRHLDELEIIFFINDTEMELLMQIDRKARGLAGSFLERFDLDESFVRFRLDKASLSYGSQYVANQIFNILNKYI